MTPDKSDLERSIPQARKRTLEDTLFNLAHAYARASDASWFSLASTKDPDFSAPAIMCQSFAVELLLKYFLARDHPSAKNVEELEAEGVKLRRRKYSDLYDQLKPATAGKDRYRVWDVNRPCDGRRQIQNSSHRPGGRPICVLALRVRDQRHGAL
jgi:hypothetical protein